MAGLKLVIDIGNTWKKTAVFSGTEIIELQKSESLTAKGLQFILGKYPAINRGILSSVVDYPPEIREFLEERIYFMEFTYQSKAPVANKYASPASLGTDRLAAATGGYSLFPGSNILIVNAGTCITYDIVDTQPAYLGGGISPGIMMRLKALNTFTGKLPFIQEAGFEGPVGRTTSESIQAGVLGGVVAEVEGMINSYRQHFPGLNTILSGGDMEYFARRLKNNIFAVPDIVLTGLNKILDFNVNQRDIY